MGHSQIEKQKTHERIVSIAAKRLREDGLEGVGVADLMKEAGLTVGGFYKHFTSRDDLVAEAMGSAFGSWSKKLEARGLKPEDLTIGQLADYYLSSYHRDNPGDGCPFPALTADFARSGPKTREIATAQLMSNFENFQKRLADEDDEAARRKAIIAFCAMAGAVGLARISDDEALSNEILETVRAFTAGLGEKAEQIAPKSKTV